MVDPVRVQGVPPVGPGRPAGPGKAAGPGFRDLLIQSIREVNGLQKEADAAIQGLATGKSDRVAEVFSAVEKADLAFRTLMEVRNKLVDAYQELMRMRV